MMKRDLNRLKDETFDLVVVGGGIYGAACVWEAASRGLCAALVERGDFGCRTSANSLKTIHGGLRYLQTLDIKRFLESVRERKILMRIAPHLVHPLPVVMPAYGHLMKGPEILRAGLLVNDVLSFSRNFGMDPSKRIPAGRILSKRSCVACIPGIDHHRVTGCASWTDAQMYNSDRVLLAFIRSAVEAGACAANYLPAEGLLRSGKSVEGIEVRDVFTGERFPVRARMVLDACGAWIARWNREDGGQAGRYYGKLSTAMNLVIERELLQNRAAGIMSRFRHEGKNGKTFKGSRVLFIAPWRQFTIAGTFHRPYEGDPDGMKVTESEIQEALSEINRAYPGAPIERREVSFVHKGFLPMDGLHDRSGEVLLTKHYRINDHGRSEGLENYISLAGVKYTTARDVAEKVVTLVLQKSGKAAGRSPTRFSFIGGGDIHRFEPYLNQVMMSNAYRLSGRMLNHLVRNYGSDYPDILKIIEENRDWAEPVNGSPEVLKAEIVHAVRCEMALRLSDTVLRRTDLGSGKHPGRMALEECARMMAGELKWDEERIQSEIRETERLYPAQPS
ncbi:glycerol-3-phosphate dehydrogenase/oxidase [bacterium]|nr:glycerol-3-phosphate dehydrogenase/oxidase [bacterium]